VSVAAWFSDGFPGRLDRDQRVMASKGADAVLYRACENRFDAPCVIGAATHRPSWVVYGDSHADALASSFSDILRARAWQSISSFSQAAFPCWIAVIVIAEDSTDGSAS
jgi:hypothetical protein